MTDDVTVKEAISLIAQAKAVIAALVGAFVLMSAVGLALLEWRVSVNVDAALAKMDLATDAKIVDMDKSIAANKRTGEENAKDISGLEDRVKLAFEALIGRPGQ